jgi:hypothetical protein
VAYCKGLPFCMCERPIRPVSTGRKLVHVQGYYIKKWTGAVVDVVRDASHTNDQSWPNEIFFGMKSINGHPSPFINLASTTIEDWIIECFRSKGSGARAKADMFARKGIMCVDSGHRLLGPLQGGSKHVCVSGQVRRPHGIVKEALIVGCFNSCDPCSPILSRSRRMAK